jgi:hypothetical protein
MDTSFQHFDPERYAFRQLCTADQRRAYEALLQRTYERLAFLDDKVLPRDHTVRYGLFFDDALVGIAALTEVRDPHSVFFQLIPALTSEGHRVRVAEMTNVIVEPAHRGTIALALLIAGCVEQAAAGGWEYLVGITRFQALAYFVEFGVIPVEHEPLHLLGRRDLLDFVIYYDTHSESSLAYLRERTRRYVHQLGGMHAIRRKHVRRRGAAQPLPARRAASGGAT